MWPKATHAEFMHPPLLKSTAGRRKNMMKSAAEGGNSKKGGKLHQCSICKKLGHHWYTCKFGDPEDIAAYEAERGPSKKKQKKADNCNTETSIIPMDNAIPSQMRFHYNKKVDNATTTTVKKKKGNSSSTSTTKKRKGSTTTTSSSTPVSTSNRSGTGSNDPVAIQVLPPVPFHEDSATTATRLVQTEPRASPRKKMTVKKKLTPKKSLKFQ